MTPEGKLQKAIVHALNQREECFAVKIHGGPHQSAGLPDIVCCCEGEFYGFEVKVPGRENTLTARQKLKIKRINEAGGRATMVTSVAQTIHYIKTGRVSN